VPLTVITQTAGDRGVLVALPLDTSADALAAIARKLRSRFHPAAAIAGHSSVLLLFVRPHAMERSIDLEIDDDPLHREVRRHDIAVSLAPQDAPDLPDVLATLGLSRDTFIEQLTAATLRPRFFGFRPGFAYLDGLPSGWNIPRRATSRTRVPRGSLGIAAGLAGFYPEESPGGWNLIGRASEAFWDPDREPPALFAPGDAIALHVVDSLPATLGSTASRPTTGSTVATCVAPGQQTLIVGPPDLARYEYGLPPGGSFDADLARRANQSAGNDAVASILECTLVGPELRFERDARVAWEGASIRWEVNGVPSEATELALRSGDVLRVGRLTGGLRGWLAISGGVESPARRYDLMPARLTKGCTVASGVHEGTPTTIELPPRGERSTIEVIAGPHPLDDLRELLASEWTVTPLLDRTGIRLSPLGTRIEAPASVPSCGMQFGSVQLHPNGDLVVMGPDHPITGGYLQPFTVTTRDLWKLAQLQPGDRVRWAILDI
jgi:KipI family sensor histidine kinase inhibitor